MIITKAILGIIYLKNLIKENILGIGVLETDIRKRENMDQIIIKIIINRATK